MQSRFVQELREAEQAARNPKRERDPSPGCEQVKKARNAVRSAPIDAIVVTDSSDSETGSEPEPELQPLLRRPGGSGVVDWKHHRALWATNTAQEAEIKRLEARCDELEAALASKTPEHCILCGTTELDMALIIDAECNMVCSECSEQSEQAEDKLCPATTSTSC